MSVQSHRGARRKTQRTTQNTQYTTLKRYLPVWLIGLMIFVLILPKLFGLLVDAGVASIKAVPGIVTDIGTVSLDVGGDIVVGVYHAGHGAVLWIGDRVKDAFADEAGPAGEIAPLFTREIDHWEDDIVRWADEYALDPNLLATVMQIESCGHPTVSSVAGAQGLFQVMPMHFGSDEDQLDPDTNAMRGAGVLNECLRMAEGDTGLAMACYNGGPSVIWRDYGTWVAETQRYYTWGTGTYADAQNSRASSATLERWLAAGGGALCDMAAAELAIN